MDDALKHRASTEVFAPFGIDSESADLLRIVTKSREVTHLPLLQVTSRIILETEV